MELECLIKAKDDRIALNKGPAISPTRNGGPKKQSPRVLQFLIRVTRVFMCQTIMTCAVVLLFSIPYQKRENQIVLNKVLVISPTRKGGSKIQISGTLQFLIKRTTI